MVAPVLTLDKEFVMKFSPTLKSQLLISTLAESLTSEVEISSRPSTLFWLLGLPLSLLFSLYLVQG